MERNTLIPFGKAIKKRLVDLNKNHSWLIEQVCARTGRYFDRSYLHKIMTGKLGAPKIVSAIREILDIPDAPTD